MEKNVAFAKARGFLLAKGFENDVVPRSASKLITFLNQSVSAKQHLQAVHPEYLEALGVEEGDVELPDPLIDLQAGAQPTADMGRQLMELEMGVEPLVELAPHLEKGIRLAVERRRMDMQEAFEKQLEELKAKNLESTAQMRDGIAKGGNPVLGAVQLGREAAKRRLLRQNGFRSS